MKCVKKDGIVKRVSDKEAFEMVKSGWSFTAKKVKVEDGHFFCAVCGKVFFEKDAKKCPKCGCKKIRKTFLKASWKA